MDYVQLGSTDLSVSSVALGCWPFAGGEVWGAQDKGDSINTVHAALDAGINFFDTAPAYEAGESERVLGEALLGRRHEAVVATKLGGSQTRPDRIRAVCRESLRNLRTDYIDLYQIHWPGHDVPAADTVAALQELKALGWIRHFSVCNYGVQDFGEISDFASIPSNQLPYNLLWRVVEAEILPLCRQRGAGLICYSPLMQGLLTGRYASADEVPDGLSRTRLYSCSRPLAQHREPGCEDLVFTMLDQIREVASDEGLSMALLSLAWVRQQAGVASILVGARNPSELTRNLPVLEVSLSRQTQARLARITEPVRSHLGSNPDMWFSESRFR